MMVSIAQTSKKYRGRKAATYDAIRVKQARWDLENEVVGRWLVDLRPGTVLDCPVGTGRYLQACRAAGVREYVGVDVSAEMVALAKRKVTASMRKTMVVRLEVGDATKHDCVDRRVDCVICVRFLDLIDEDAMRAVLTECCRVSRKSVLLTIRLGDKYRPKSNTAEHDRRKFLALVSRLGFRVEETVLFREGDWNIVKLGRSK